MSHPESDLVLSLRLKKTKHYIEHARYNGSIRMFDILMNTKDEYIKLRMFFGCIYVMQKMYPDAIHSVRNAQRYVSKRVMGKELIKNRMKR